jgi:Glycosyl hydrolases family 2, sugar binding domain/Glycosyl hydrolases family 2/Glycosyl hydrolases family 2, TIM barrel domain
MSSSLPLSAQHSPQRVELDYGWEFLADRSGTLLYPDLEKAKDWRPARAGLSWNVQFPDLRDYQGAAWYRIHFDVPQFADTRHVILRFGAVDYFAEVHVNGTCVGSHEGGYTPFSFDVTSSVHPGQNELAIRVIDPPMDEEENRALFPDLMYNEIPHGKQNWYIQNSGIWQGVRLEFLPAIYIDRADVVPNISGEFTLEIRLAGIGLNPAARNSTPSPTLHVAVSDTTGREVFRTSAGLGDQNTIEIHGMVRNPQLWEPGNPALYTVDIALVGKSEHRRRTRFGFRKFEARDGGLFLNNKPFYMRATLDQDFYPETIHTPASEEFVREMMLKAQRLGVNVLRCHLKVAHPVYLDVADELGMLVWAELPSWSDCWFPSDHFSTRAAVREERMFTEVLIRDWNHPCIVIQTIMNESWGINLKQPDQRKWLREVFERIKQTLAPLGRLVVDNSPCEGNFHLRSDLDDFHQYYSMPDQVQKWDTWLRELSARPDWTYSPYGDAERTGKEPILVSEFGNWGLPKLPQELPWWFFTSFGGREVTTSTGVLERFHQFGFDTVFKDFDDLAVETQWHQFISLKHEIESIRSYQSIQGYVITGMTDIHWEANGLLDMWRKEKVFADDLARLQRGDIVFCKLPKHNFVDGERVQCEVLLSHYGEKDLRGARLHWSTSSGERGQIAVPAGIAQGTVVSLGIFDFTARLSEPSIAEHLALELRSSSGSRLAENSYPLYVVAEPSNRREGRLFVHDPLGTLSGLPEALVSAGYEVLTGKRPGADELLLASAKDAIVDEHLARGGSCVLLLDSADALPQDFDLKVTPRKGTELEGRWFSNFNWIRNQHPVFRNIGFSRVLGFESEHVVPEHILQGLAPEGFRDAIAGITYGWLNKNAALALEIQVGEGRALLTTFRFGAYGSDPYATHLLENLISYAGSREFTDKFRLRPALAASNPTSR